MADEQKTVQDETPESENKVELSQSKIDSLIDKSFSKGAKRAQAELAERLGVDSIEQAQELINAKREADEAGKTDLEKALEEAAMLKNTIESLESSNKQLQTDMAVERVVAQNGIKDADYFKHLLKQAASNEDFSQEAFIDQLKGDKPYLFNDGVAAQPKPRVDGSSNKASLDVTDRIKNAQSMDELYKLQNEII